MTTSLALRYGLSPHVFGLAFDAWALWVLGFPDHALQRMQEACALAQTLVHPYSGAFAHFYAARLHLFRGEISAAQAQAEACIALATAQEFPHLVALASIVRGTVLAAQGQREEGLALLHQGAAALQASGGTLDLTIYMPSLAEVTGQVGRIAEGLEGLAKALAVVVERGQDFMEAELYRSQGALLLQQDSPNAARAEACFQQALAIAHRQQAKALELRAAMSLSRLWQRQGKRTEARALLAPIYDWFTEGFDTFDLQEARALLEAL